MHKPRTDKPRIWGYARVSKKDNGQVGRDAGQASDDASEETSVQRQTAGIKKKAAEIAAEHGCVFAAIEADAVSGADVGFDERVGYQKLIRQMEPGDHLVVWQLSRIDRNPFRLYRACEFLVRRDIHIHSYGDTQGEIDLDTAMGRAQLAIWGIVNDLFIENLRKSIKEALQWRKEQGLAYNRVPPLGKRREYSKNGKPIKSMPPIGDKTYTRMDVWDETECRLIREIKRRRDDGESFDSIAYNFAAREEKTWDGRLWAPMRRKKQQGRKRIEACYVRRAYEKYEKLLAEEKDLEL